MTPDTPQPSTDTEGFIIEPAPTPAYRLGAVTGETMRAALEEAEEAKCQLPATFCDPDEHRECHDCGKDLADRQAHFDRRGNVFCVDCAHVPRCRYCDERVENDGEVHAGGCGSIG